MVDILLAPGKWKIEIERDGNKAKVVYEEWLRREGLSREQWYAVAENTKRVIANMLPDGIEVRELVETDDEMYICIELESDIESIASAIVMEFLPFSGIRNMSLSELVQYAIVGGVIGMGGSLKRRVDE